MPNPRLCNVFGGENVMRRNGAPSASLGERCKTGGVRRSGAYGRLQINALTWGVRTLPFGQCGVWFLPSPKLALGAPLRRRDARTTKLPRSGADWARALRRLRAIANQCVDLGRSNLTLRAMRRLVPALPQASLGAPLRRQDARTPNYARTGRGLRTGTLALTGDCKSMR